MTFYQYPDYMYHHGVKGMKWGVRKANRYSAVKTSSKGSKKSTSSKRLKTGLKIAAGVGVSVAAAYGAHKLGNLKIQREYELARAYGESYIQGLLKSSL